MRNYEIANGWVGLVWKNLIQKNAITKLVVSFVDLSTAFVFSIFILKFSMIFRILASLLGFTASIIYYALTI